MELEDLRAEWQMRDALLTKQLDSNNQLLRASMFDRHADEIRRLDPLGWAYWGSFLMTMILLGSFIAENIGEPRFLIPALVLEIWVIVMHATHVYLRDALRKVNFGDPVVAVQQQLESIRQKRLTQFKWGFLTGQVVWWIPFVIVVFRGLFQVDLYTVNDFMPQFMLTNVLIGLAVIPVLLVVTRYVVNRFQHMSVLNKVLNSLSGRDIQASMAFVKRLVDLEGN